MKAGGLLAQLYLEQAEDIAEAIKSLEPNIIKFDPKDLMGTSVQVYCMRKGEKEDFDGESIGVFTGIVRYLYEVIDIFEESAPSIAVLRKIDPNGDAVFKDEGLETLLKRLVLCLKIWIRLQIKCLPKYIYFLKSKNQSGMQTI